MRSILALLLLLSVSACRARPASLAPSTTPVKKGEYVVMGDAVGTSWGAMLFIIPVNTWMAETARDNAIAKYPGADGLVNVTMDYTIFYLPLATITRARVYGEAFKRID
ncbi:MAG: hypothetical protein V2A76_10455 [Planctomycetota bacterium]